LKQEYFKQSQTIQKLSQKLEKVLKENASQQVIDLKLELQKCQYKLKKQQDLKEKADRAKL